MKPIEQIYISVRTVSGRRTARTAARSDGVPSCDIEELLNWFSGSTADNFIQTRRRSFFFHPLPSGCFAFGKIIPEINPQKKNGVIHTPHTSLKEMFQVQVFLVPAEMLLLYGNNPLALEQELRRRGIITDAGILLSGSDLSNADLSDADFSGRIENIVFPAVKPLYDIELFDADAVKKLCGTLGIFKIAEVLQNVSDNISLILTLPETMKPLEFLKALFSLLPLRFRTELSFSTEVHISESHPFRLILVNENKRRIEELSALSGIPYAVMKGMVMKGAAAEGSNEVITEHSFDPYSQFIFQIIQNDSLSFLKQKLAEEYRDAVSALLAGLDGETDAAVFNPVSEWETLHIPAVRYLEEYNQNTCLKPQPSAVSGHTLSDIEKIKPLLRSSASAEHILALLKQESKHLTDLLINIQKTK